MSDLFDQKGAIFGADPRYRYVLWRNFVPTPVDQCLWIMLNPSTATADTDDPTIRRCQDFTRLWGYDACRVVNIFAYRSTDPKALTIVADPVGPDNDAYIIRETAAAQFVVCAWGAHGALRQRSTRIRELLSAVKTPSWCFGLTRNGEPTHPLYQRADAPLLTFA